MKPCLGIDLGNVIIDHLSFGTTRDYVEHGDYTLIPPMKNVMESLRILNDGMFEGNIFVVYNATDVADSKILAWLEFHNFYEATGISRDRVHRTENGRDKSSICLRYKATHFVDDRLEVLKLLIGKVPNLYLLRPQEEEVKQFQDALPYVYRANEWTEIIALI